MLPGAAPVNAAARDLVADSLVAQLDFPRFELRDLNHGRDVILATLRTTGLQAQVDGFQCRTHRADVAGACSIAAALVLVWAARRASRRLLVVAGVFAALAIAAIAGALDPFLPAQLQSNLHLAIESSLPPRAEIILGAHYDTKTEPLDHLERGGLFGLAVVVVILAGLRVGRGRDGRVWAWLAALGFFAIGLQWTTGRFLRPSHGAVDNGAAAMLLVEMAARYAVDPLSQTRLVFAWWAGEEQGAQGSAAAARRAAGNLPRAVINLECIGAGPELGFARFEWNAWRAYPADPNLRRAAHRAMPLRALPFPVVTDAGSFLARGIPALTLVGLPHGSAVPRGLHRATDRQPRLDPRGLAIARATLDALVRGLDDASNRGATP